MPRKAKSKRGRNRWADAASSDDEDDGSDAAAAESTSEEDVSDGDADDDGEDGDDDDDDEDGEGDDADDHQDENARCGGVSFLVGRLSVLEIGSFKEFTVDASDASGPCIRWGIYNEWCVAQTPC